MVKTKVLGNLRAFIHALKALITERLFKMSNETVAFKRISRSSVDKYLSCIMCCVEEDKDFLLLQEHLLDLRFIKV